MLVFLFLLARTMRDAWSRVADQSVCYQTSKVMNYVSHKYAAPYFAFFVGVWIYLRHYLNLRILWAVLTEFSAVGPYELNWETQQYKCWISQVITFVLLASIQALNLFWLFLILRIAYRYAVKNIAKDDRSDDEEDEEEEQVQPPTEESKTPEVLVNGQPIDENQEGQRNLRPRKKN